MRTATALALIVATILLIGTKAADGRPSASTGMTYLDNGIVRVGVSLADGGKITYVGRASGESTNLVQEVQPSYYSGPFAVTGYPGWHAFASGGTVVAQSNDGKTIYTKTRATREFAGPCECFFEQWVRVKGRAVLVHNRLTAFRSDTTRYDARPQELPALYSTGAAYRVVTYLGPKPYTGDRLSEITAFAGRFFTPGWNWYATEHWAALVDDDGLGIGLFKPDLVRFAGIPGTREAIPSGWVNGYLTSSANEVMDANQAYDYDYTLVVGSLRQIRSYASAHRPDPRPAYSFRWDREHWWYVNTTDRGRPWRGALRIVPARDDPQLIGPESWWRAKDVPVLYVRGRWASAQHVAEIFWSIPGASFSEDRKALLAGPSDGQFHTFRVRLAGLSGYSGWITGIRLDPVYTAEPGAEVDIACISWKPCPVDRAAERAIETSGPVPYLDSFDGDRIDPAFWQEVRGGTGPSLTVSGALELTVPKTTTFDPLGSLREGVRSRCTLKGDFDVQVEYRLLDWPEAGGVHLNLGTNWPQAVGRENHGVDAVFAWFPPDVVNVPFSDSSGSLRMVQHGSLITGYVRRQGTWLSLLTARTSHAEAAIQLTVSSNDFDFARTTVRVAFDNFRVNTGRLVCP